MLARSLEVDTNEPIAAVLLGLGAGSADYQMRAYCEQASC